MQKYFKTHPPATFECMQRHCPFGPAFRAPGSEGLRDCIARLATGTKSAESPVTCSQPVRRRCAQTDADRSPTGALRSGGLTLPETAPPLSPPPASLHIRPRGDDNMHSQSFVTPCNRRTQAEQPWSCRRPLHAEGFVRALGGQAELRDI